MLNACANNETQLVAHYLRNGADPNYQHPDCRTSPFFVAIHAGHWHCVQLLLDAGASTADTEHRTGLTPLQLALYRRDHAIVDLLLARLSSQEQKRDGFKTILVSGCMGQKLLQILAATGHMVLVDDELVVSSMIQQIQVATRNTKIKLANMMSKELVNVTDLILREGEGVRILEYLAEYAPSMADLGRIIVITTQPSPSAELAWLLRNNSKVIALVVPSWWDTLLDTKWMAKWQATIWWMLTSNDLVPGKIYNYRRQTVSTPVHATAPTAPENEFPSETELWNVRHNNLIAVTATKPDVSSKVHNRQFQPGMRPVPKPEQRQGKKRKKGAIVPWYCACHTSNP